MLKERKAVNFCFLSAVALLLAGMMACVQRKNKSASGPEEIQKVDVPKSQLAFELFNPEMAKVTVSPAELGISEFGGTFALPSFGIQFNGNDYIKILRCQDSYRVHLEYLISKADQGSQEERKWIWADSLGNPRVCKIASLRFNGTEFQDLGAKNGNLFYLINPCVSAAISSTGRDTCSNNLALTNSLNYTQSPSAAVLQKASELSDAESAYDAHISMLMGKSRDLMNRKTACEYGINHAQTKDNIKSFGWDLLAAGVAVGGFFAVRGMFSWARKGKAASEVAESGMRSRYLTLASKTKNFLNGIDSTLGQNKIELITGGVFAAALAVRTLYSRYKTQDPKSKTVPACEEADQVAASILEMQKQKALDYAMEEIIRISKEISAMDQKFAGYSEKSFLVQ